MPLSFITGTPACRSLFLRDLNDICHRWIPCHPLSLPVVHHPRLSFVVSSCCSLSLSSVWYRDLNDIYRRWTPVVCCPRLSFITPGFRSSPLLVVRCFFVLFIAVVIGMVPYRDLNDIYRRWTPVVWCPRLSFVTPGFRSSPLLIVRCFFMLFVAVVIGMVSGPKQHLSSLDLVVCCPLVTPRPQLVVVGFLVNVRVWRAVDDLEGRR